MTLLVNPLPRFGAMISELTASNKLVLFGGRTYDQYLSDTYTWDGTAWTLSTATGPIARSDAAIAYDGTNIVLVGGTDGINYLSDTWTFNGTAWTKQALTNVEDNGYSIPTTLRNASMAYQSGSGKAYLFGGTAAYQRHYVQDTWSWQSGSPGTWTKLNPASSPTGRMYSAYASNSTTAVLFGGKADAGPLGSTFKFNGTNWTQVSGLTSGVNAPNKKYGAMMSYHAAMGKFVLFGGATTQNYENTLWTFDGVSTWTNITPATNPPGRAFGAMAYHTASSSVIMFGGQNYAKNGLGDTWSLSSAGLWTAL